MDGRKSQIQPTTPCGRIDADAAPTDSVRESSSVAYFGDAARLNEGFAIALRAMGIDPGVLMPDAAPSDTTSNPEDN
ncbi:hypothetical protein LJR220_003752 [Bradyrhizobium sp. LjRoot220]|uniref:hypothetical protein n=1 Tax=Bradyrhizobium sp. LjRoot220 TaxID=3342284 RepID=UPI003ED158AF